MQVAQDEHGAGRSSPGRQVIRLACARVLEQIARNGRRRQGADRQGRSFKPGQRSQLVSVGALPCLF